MSVHFNLYYIGSERRGEEKQKILYLDFSLLTSISSLSIALIKHHIELFPVIQRFYFQGKRAYHLYILISQLEICALLSKQWYLQYDYNSKKRIWVIQYVMSYVKKFGFVFIFYIEKENKALSKKSVSWLSVSCNSNWLTTVHKL